MEKLNFKIQLSFTSTEREIIFLILVLHIVSFPLTVWTLLPAWEVWLYLKLKSNSLCGGDRTVHIIVFLTASLLLTCRTEQCTVWMV